MSSPGSNLGINFLVGDFNAWMDNDHQISDGVLGHHGVGRMNSNDLRLLSICKEFSLIITNTYSQQLKCGKTSWIHPRSKDWHFIDFFIPKKRNSRDISITRTFHTIPCLSDHALRRSKASFRIVLRKLQKTSMSKWINTMALKLQDKQSELYRKLGTALNVLNITNDIESFLKTL